MGFDFRKLMREIGQRRFNCATVFDDKCPTYIHDTYVDEVLMNVFVCYWD